MSNIVQKPQLRVHRSFHHKYSIVKYFIGSECTKYNFAVQGTFLTRRLLCRVALIVILRSFFFQMNRRLYKCFEHWNDHWIEKFDLEFMKYICNFPKISGERNIDILKKSKDKQIIVFKNRREANQFFVSGQEYKAPLALLG